MNDYLRDIEQKCVKAGYWRIEGYDVERLYGNGTYPTVWDVKLFGERCVTVRTLTDARYWIRNQIAQAEEIRY